MTSKTTKRITSIFAEASLEKIARHKLNGREWNSYQKMVKTQKAEIDKVKQTYKDQYQTRVEQARLRLINKAGRKTREFKPRWIGDDLFNKDAINRQAHRDVQNAHQRHIQTLNSSHLDKQQAFIDRSASRQAQQGKPTREFNRKVDRRNSDERRQGHTQTSRPTRTMQRSR